MFYFDSISVIDIKNGDIGFLNYIHLGHSLKSNCVVIMVPMERTREFIMRLSIPSTISDNCVSTVDLRNKVMENS